MAYILSLNTLAQVSKELRKQGKRVVFTHGSFDILHAGHSYLFNQSKDFGSVLIVGMDSEKRIRMFKQLERTIIPDKARLEMLSNHKSIDFIYHITGNTPWVDDFYLDIYKKIQPNTITYGRTFGFKNKFKQKSYQMKNTQYMMIPEIAFDGISTSKIIETAKNL